MGSLLRVAILVFVALSPLAMLVAIPLLAGSPSGTPTNPLIYAGVAGGFLIAWSGLTILFTAMRVHGAGPAPHCEGCGYSLATLRGDCCPECGRRLEPRPSNGA